MPEGLGGQHTLHGEKKEGGVDECDHDCDLEEIEKNLRLDSLTPVGVGEEEHHQNRSAVEAIEQVAHGV